MSRRTKLQIAHDNYCVEVDQYNWFILDLETNRIVVGYELRDDCVHEQIDNDSKDYTKIVSKRAVKNYGININEVLTDWKQS